MSNLKSTAKNTKFILLFLLIIFIFYLIIKNIQSSIFLKGKDRVNIIFYSETPTVYSFGFRDVSYQIQFAPDTQILVPGGYGFYRIGALGKLVSLEKKPEIFQKTFSSATSSFIDLYFYKVGSTIYYGTNYKPDFLPSVTDILFNQSNSSFIDRFFLLWSFNINRNRFTSIDNTAPFDREEFYKHYQGYFYKKTYRNLKDNVQILYTKSYKTATIISELIEGEGIRVIDLSQQNSFDRCEVLAAANKIKDAVASDLASFFNCSLKTGKTEISDIILILGNLEKEWEVD